MCFFKTKHICSEDLDKVLKLDVEAGFELTDNAIASKQTQVQDYVHFFVFLHLAILTFPVICIATCTMRLYCAQYEVEYALVRNDEFRNSFGNCCSTCCENKQTIRNVIGLCEERFDEQGVKKQGFGEDAVEPLKTPGCL